MVYVSQFFITITEYPRQATSIKEEGVLWLTGLDIHRSEYPTVSMSSDCVLAGRVPMLQGITGQDRECVLLPMLVWSPSLSLGSQQDFISGAWN